MPLTNKALSIIDNQLQQYLQSTPSNNFDREIWKNLRILSTSANSSGRTTNVHFSVVIPENCGNTFGIAAGGAVATLFDGVTGAAICAVDKDGTWNGSEVSRSLSMTYYRPIALGEEVNIDCEVVDVGKRLATVRGVMTRASDGRVLATCQHEKVCLAGTAKL
ncbi:hypothetical protein M409DRAFT_30444 [Zasmidium cellare ATCC 36951]|uniref:Thioesterase domain-containing protein n=1 Tax=Zasmidium cellare ATCC 36951 TaxID=1080233 RepID=A0A6A6BZ18_ZASCE|nr:uncharacterized protein M409DRAFT_30444 [Zasmidium cellare ATCC 36951]KAF2159160.1 hypothetical protein M409DRAFT_30444 [Zasmidium cellare ATCC 36951]